VFSYVDLVRAEIGIEAEVYFGLTIPEAEWDGWRTLGDVARSVSRRAAGTSEAEVFAWLCVLIAEGYGVSAPTSPDAEVFGDADRAAAWFSRPPYPRRLGDRFFAKDPPPARPPGNGGDRQ
jgi:hypothetical protein